MASRNSRFGGLSRRHFIAASGAAGLVLGSGNGLRAAETADVIVLGAGLAGLNSAMILEELGYRVTVLEASDHVGGRVQTKNFAGHLHELGASDIGVLYARVLDMARRLDLSVVPSSIKVRPFTYHVGGQLVPADKWANTKVNQTVGDERVIEPSRLESHFLNGLNPLVELDDWLKPEHAPLDIPIGDYLRKNGVSPAAIDLIGHTYNGNAVERTSALAMFRDNARTRAGITAWKQRTAAGEKIAPLRQIAGGNQRLPEAMAATLEQAPRLQQAAVRVEQDTKTVEVTCLDGSRYRAARLICALPLTALRHIDFRPGLSPAKVTAAANGEYYAATKFYLRPTAPFWEQDGLQPSLWSDGPLERVFALTDNDDEVHTLLVWINGAGSRRIDQLPVAEAGKFVIEQLTKIRPAAQGKLELMGHQAWGRTAYIGGCGFSYAARQVNELAQEISAAEGLLHFAGEHTRRREHGLESAMASAERVAQEIAAG